ncbi:MAG: threonylcarbamoyl-AMP synthase, partial [Chlorobiales bacterium]|nr:threonylcarbamoyl-AMP synthase [Chlorobiales bacterium]
VLRGKPSAIGLESTIVDCSGPVPILLRAGAITLEQLQKVLPDINLNTLMDKHEPPKSPGLKYPHYSPKASIVIYRSNENITIEPSAAYIGLSEPPRDVLIFKICQNLKEYGRELFTFFRHCDREGIKVIYCELPSNKGIGRAIRDRLLRASESP